MKTNSDIKIFKCRPRTVLTAVAAVLLFGVVLGFIWSSIDYNRIKNLDYRVNSEYIFHRTDVAPSVFLPVVKRKFKDNGMHIARQYQVSGTEWELVGHPGRTWLSSEFISKITVVDTLGLEEGGGNVPKQTLVAYLGSVETGSKEYVFLFFLITVVTLVTLVRREALPHIFDKNPGSKGMNR